ncbi:MAG: hypothetical protein HQ591_12930 [candidate division Zixibacteria bacterium]|nr:hypothetical protein [Candidatus Tariuqbacter arcticus]
MFETIVRIATLVAAIVAIVGVPLTYWRIRIANCSLRGAMYSRILDMMEPVREYRHLLERKLKEPNLKVFDSLSEGEKKNLDNLARTYDKLGLLVKHSDVPLEFVLDFYSRPLVVAWHRLSPHINRTREERNQPGHMVKFEMLAIAAKLHRDKYHKGEETFPLSEEDLRRWKTWK